MTVFKHELAASLTPEESSAVNFIGVFDQGRRLTLMGHGSNKAYIYDVSSDPITPVEFSRMLKRSLGREWKRIKNTYPLIETIDNISGIDVQAEKWYESDQTSPAPVEEWAIGGDRLYAF